MQWDSEQYWQKARAYVRRASDASDPSDRAFWSALSLEFLARGAITKIHPVLNAAPQSETNIFYAVGLDIKEPRSLPIRAVFSRLARFVPEFESSRSFCEFFMVQRDRELHTSELAFEQLKESKWLARYYKACKVLSASMGYAVVDLFGADEADVAEQMIAAADSDKKKEVLGRIAAHKRVFSDKPESERTALEQQQDTLSKSWGPDSTSVTCPACGLKAKLIGELERESEPQLDGDEVVVEKTYLVTDLECAACGLRLKGVEEVYHGDVEPHFALTESADLHDYFEPDHYDEYNNM